VNVSCPECRSVFRVDPAKLPPTSVRARCSVCGGVISIATGPSTDDEFSSNSALPSVPPRAVGASERPVAARASQGLAAALADTLAPPPAAPRSPTPAPNSVVSVMPPAPQAPPSQSAPATMKPSGLPPTPKGPAPGASANRPVLFPPRPMMPGGAPHAAPASRPIVAPRPSTASNVGAPAPSAPAAPRQSGGFAAPSQSVAPAGVSVASPPASTAAAPPPRPTTAPPAGAPAAARTPINPFLANDPHAKAKRLARALVSDLVTYFPQKRQDGLRDGTLKQLFKDEIQKSYEEYVAQIGREFAETTPHFQDALNDLLAGGQKVF
jgi:predicted Zn finger-like uncharacterized protein